MSEDTRSKERPMDLNELSAPALAAAMKGGTETWGQWGSMRHHVPYVQPISGRGAACAGVDAASGQRMACSLTASAWGWDVNWTPAAF
jgi:hypothetical protein